MSNAAYNPTLPTETRDGRKVEILKYGLKLKDGESIVALVTNSDGAQWSSTWFDDGRFNAQTDDHENDLVNVPKKKTVYTLVWLNGVHDLIVGATRDTLQEAVNDLDVNEDILVFHLEDDRPVRVEVFKEAGDA